MYILLVQAVYSNPDIDFRDFFIILGPKIAPKTTFLVKKALFIVEFPTYIAIDELF